jgi:hypothetical protein
MSNKYMKKCSTSLAREGKQAKTTRRLIPVRLECCHRENNNKCCSDCEVGRRNLYTLLKGCKLMQPPQKSIWPFLRKLKTEIPYDPAILLLGIYPKKSKSA